MSCVAVLLLVYKQSLPSYIRDGLFAITVLAFIGIKLLFFLYGVDALSFAERHACYLLFGGLVDDLQAWAETYASRDQEDPAAR